MMNRAMINVLFGDNNKNRVNGNLHVKIKGLKVDYSYEGPRGADSKQATEGGKIELEEFEIDGDFETTMSGLMKLAYDIGETIRHQKPELYDEKVYAQESVKETNSDETN